MRDQYPNVTSVTLPSGAGPNDPAIVLGDQIPANLVAYYAGFGGQVVIAAMIFRLSATEYDWIALVDDGGLTSLAMGAANATGLDEITSMYRNGAVPTLVLGSGQNSTVAVDTGSLFSIRNGAMFNIDGITQGRGLVAQASAVASTGAIGAETVTLTSPAKTYTAGRCYEVRLLSNLAASVLNNQAILRLRIAGGGAIAAEERSGLLPAVGSFASETHAAQFQVASTGSYTWDETITATAGTVIDSANATGTARRFTIWDIGDVADFTNVRSV